MVILCNEPYANTDSDESKYTDAFNKFSFELSDFQKYSIQAIIDGHHSLVTAHTGSGKTLPAEFAINHFTGLGKKVVYTSPIKALSNQKYYEFQRKFPDISIGLFTGDIKTNPCAQVLIMTTEILMNYLFSLDPSSDSHGDDFELNIQDELACVVFDEVHYINDRFRGQNWEQTILMLPPHVQMVMLSATIDNPEKFAAWCERGDENPARKQVVLSSTHHRVVPLTHYGFLTTNEGVFKRIRDKETQQQIRQKTDKFVVLKTANGGFQTDGFGTLKSCLDLFDKHGAFMNRTHVLNNLAKQLKEEDMLPAIAFVFSRKLVESYANSITTNILEFDSKIPYTIKGECDAVLRGIPNYKEYSNLPEYGELVALLEKGIGIHHSGMIPVFREIVETMIGRGHIKLLFATESFAIGLDCPIRTAVFTSLTKFDGAKMRYLLPHEYNQAAGRAGRRGLDTVGHVVHCNNMFDLPSSGEYSDILCGSPQALVSKFHISFSTVLCLMRNGKTGFNDFVGFVEKSMLRGELDKAIDSENVENGELLEELKQKRNALQNMRTPLNVCEKYLSLTDDGGFKLSNKQRKAQEREIMDMKDDYKFLLKDVDEVISLHKLEKEFQNSSEYIESCQDFIVTKTRDMCALLRENGFLLCSGDNSFDFTDLGEIASMVSETHGLVTADFMDYCNFLDGLTEEQIVGVLSVFSDIKVGEDYRSSVAKTDVPILKKVVRTLVDLHEKYAELEHKYDVVSGYDYEAPLVLDIIDPMQEWCGLESENECKYFIQTQLVPLEIGLGDFTKGILKMSAIAKEWMKVAVKKDKVELMSKLSKIDGLILKFVATTQSLYV